MKCKSILFQHDQWSLGMVGGLRDREDAMERKFQHDNEVEFKIRARAQKRFATWAGEQLHLKDIELETYAQKKLSEFVRSPNDMIVLEAIASEFEKGQVPFTIYQLEKMLANFTAEARKQLTSQST